MWFCLKNWFGHESWPCESDKPPTRNAGGKALLAKRLSKRRVDRPWPHFGVDFRDSRYSNLRIWYDLMNILQLFFGFLGESGEFLHEHPSICDDRSGMIPISLASSRGFFLSHAWWFAMSDDWRWFLLSEIGGASGMAGPWFSGGVSYTIFNIPYFVIGGSACMALSIVESKRIKRIGLSCIHYWWHYMNSTFWCCLLVKCYIMTYIMLAWAWTHSNPRCSLPLEVTSQYSLLKLWNKSFVLFKVFGSQNPIGNPKTSNTLEKMNQHADFDGSTLRSNPKVCSFRCLRSKLESSRPQRSTRACRWSRIRMISSHERVGGPSAVCGDVVDPLQLMVERLGDWKFMTGGFLDTSLQRLVVWNWWTSAKIQASFFPWWYPRIGVEWKVGSAKLTYEAVLWTGLQWQWDKTW